MNVARSCPIILIFCSLSTVLFLGQTGFFSGWETSPLVQWTLVIKERLPNLKLSEFQLKNNSMERLWRPSLGQKLNYDMMVVIGWYWLRHPIQMDWLWPRRQRYEKTAVSVMTVYPWRRGGSVMSEQMPQISTRKYVSHVISQILDRVWCLKYGN